MKEVVKKEIIKLLDAGIIYPIEDSPWVSLVHCVPKKEGMTVVTNEKNEPVTIRTVTRWRILIELVDHEKTTFTCPYGTYAYKRMPFGLCSAPVTFPRCMIAIFQDMLETFIEVFMDNFPIFGNSFDSCLINLEQMLIRCKQANLVLNWEKCHFTMREGIVLGHKVSSAGLEVDREKIKVTAKLPSPTNIKAVRNFLGHARFYIRFIKDFSKISRPMTKLLEKDSVFDFNEECIKAFKTLTEKLMNASIMVSPDWSQPFELMCDASDFTIGAIKNKKGAENVAADNLLGLENSNLEELRDEDIDDNFPDETLMNISTNNNEEISCHHGPTGGHYGSSTTAKIVFDGGFYWLAIIKEAHTLVQNRDTCQRSVSLSRRDEMPLNSIQIYKALTKAYHDKKLRIRKEFKAGDKVLLLNSKYKFKAPKLISKWYRPFVVKHGLSSRYVKLYDKHGGSFIVHGHRVKLYHDEEQLNELSSKEIHFMCEKGIVRGNILYIKGYSCEEVPLKEK
ncbi:reverse transcriptase domain-containing protein [Tanacetum coccineum]